MEYFKKYGREPEEIELWLKTRSWFSTFRDRITDDILLERYGIKEDNEEVNISGLELGIIRQEVKSIISGKYDKTTISSAFNWNDTPEGTVYWGKREYQFLMWYFGQYVDFHLFK